MGLTTVTVRAILSNVDDTLGRADAVAQRLSQAIRLGLLLDGEQLPPEARLAEQMGVSTVTLREALAALRQQRLVVTRRGRGGGTFVRAPEDLARELGQRLRQISTQELRDLGDLRAAVSGMAAKLAAERALPEEVESLARQVDRLAAARTTSERRRADTQFSIEVAAAAQSPRLTQEELRLRTEVGDLLWLQLDDADHQESVTARRQLVAAIQEQRADQARELAERHVATDTQRLLQLRLQMYTMEPGR
jgi:DNA-binding FadR family transcriptional regulator